MTQFPKFPGMERVTTGDLRLLIDMAERARLDPVALGAIISMESGWRPDAKGTPAFNSPPYAAVGIIQFAPSTAISLGTTGEDLLRMSFAEQVPYAVEYFRRAHPQRPGDYYLAGWGAPVGTGDSVVLAKSGQKVYEVNKGLDTNGNGEITAAELRARVDNAIARAKAAGSVFVPESGPAVLPSSPQSEEWDAWAAKLTVPVMLYDSTQNWSLAADYEAVVDPADYTPDRTVDAYVVDPTPKGPGRFTFTNGAERWVKTAPDMVVKGAAGKPHYVSRDGGWTWQTVPPATRTATAPQNAPQEAKGSGGSLGAWLGAGIALALIWGLRK